MNRGIRLQLTDFRKAVEGLIASYTTDTRYMTDQGTFQIVMNRAFELLGLTESEIVREFGTSLPSVALWKKGLTAPHPAMRQHVYAWLIDRTTEAESTI